MGGRSPQPKIIRSQIKEEIRGKKREENPSCGSLGNSLPWDAADAQRVPGSEGMLDKVMGQKSLGSRCKMHRGHIWESIWGISHRLTDRPCSYIPPPLIVCAEFPCCSSPKHQVPLPRLRKVKREEKDLKKPKRSSSRGSPVHNIRTIIIKI